VALPNPTLTHQKTPWVRLAAQTPQGLITAIEAAVALLTGTDSNWTTTTPTGSVAARPATVLIPPATSPILTKFSAIIGVSDGATPAAAQCLDTDPVLADGTCCAFGGQYVAGNHWDVASPFGAAVRTSGFAARVVPAVSATAVFSVMVIASEETIFVGYQLNATRQEHYGQWFGAILMAPDLASAEDGAAAAGGERLYGMFTTGNAGNTSLANGANGTIGLISSTFNGFGLDNAGTGQGKGAIFNPGDDTTLLRMEMVRTWSTPTAQGMGKTLGGNPFFRAIYVAQASSPYTPFGRARALCFYDRAFMGEIVQDTTGTDRGFVISGNYTQPCEALVFVNLA
jgi:hypothetical protein